LDLDGETFLEHYVHSLWAAGRILIVNNEPEAPALSAEIIAAFGFVDMSISDPDLKARWFALPPIRELAEIVGFESSAPEESDSIELDTVELGLLRDMASGSLPESGSDEVDALLAKLGVGSPAEALEFSIKTGVAWQ
jgi:hypothetical protein